MDFPVPASLAAEHHELHRELKSAITSGGRTGEAARAVADLLHPHFLKEEEYAIPPLSLLPALARGEVEPGMAEVLKLTDKLEAELPHMLHEHGEIVQALGALVEAARAEGRSEVAGFAERLQAHARAEEELHYPAAILVGRYLKAVLK